MPFILLSGWLLAGVEASPSDIALTTQASILLGMGFAFLLAVFPLYSWVPMLAEETPPYVLGFMLWTLHTFSLVFAVGFMDRYAWLRSSPQLTDGMAFFAAAMVVSAGWFAVFQRHLGRLMALAAVAETGLALLALSLGTPGSTALTFRLLLPRGIEIALFALALSILARRSPSLRLADVRGMSRSFPLATTGAIIAGLSMAGLPLFAGFPARLTLVRGLAAGSGAPGWCCLG
jgi:formate hydrogenlyase subunit 3/multisubunit Na+/H+ antiporter MnhD subunit